MKSSNRNAETLDEIFVKIGFGKFHVIVIIIYGFFQCFDAMELIMLAFLGPVLSCFWRISLLESSYITMSVFFGMICGSLSLGKFSDYYGRKKTTVVSVCGIFYFGLICAASPTVFWITICRFFIGVFIGGVMITISTFLTEMMPLHHRGIAQMCVMFFWPVGSFFITFLTLEIVPRFGWRMWLFISSSPMIFILPTLIWIPESPRYLLLQNRKSKAIEIINNVASMNNAEPISDIKLVEYKKSSLYDIFHDNYIWTTGITTYICFVSGVTYYTYVISASIIHDIPRKCFQSLISTADSMEFSNSSIDNSCCFDLSWNSMTTVFISITGELISYTISIIAIKFVKRKIYLQILFFINMIDLIVMNFCLSKIYMGVVMMFGRGSAITMFGVIYLYISEIFPTTTRSFSLGLGSSFARIGAMAASVVVNMLMIKVSFVGATILCFALNTIGFLLVFLLPYETKDRILLQSVDEEITGSEIIKSSD